MKTPVVTIGDRDFQVPEYSVRQQRTVTPLLMKVAGFTGDLTHAEQFGELLDAVYTCLTVPDRQGNPINEISKDEFEDLKTGPLVIATVVLPALMLAAGLKPPGSDSLVRGGAGDAAPETPLSGGSTSTT